MQKKTGDRDHPPQGLTSKAEFLAVMKKKALKIVYRWK